MSYVVLTSRERGELVELFFQLKKKGEAFPLAREEAMTALRCLKAIHSNFIEDKKVDRIFLQVLLHGAGIPDKSAISPHYQNAANELTSQEKMLRWLEGQVGKRTKFSLSLLLDMHRSVFEQTSPDFAGSFRREDVRITGMLHRPPHHSKMQEILFQRFGNINDELFAITEITPETFQKVLRLSAEVHYLIAHVHPFEDGNGRIARAAGDYAMMVHGFYYDVIMTSYRDQYLDAMAECSLTDASPLCHFLEFSYLETLRRISGFFDLIKTGP